MAVTEQDIRERLLRARINRARTDIQVRRVSDEERARGERFSALANESNPFLVGSGAAFDEMGAGLKQLGITTVNALNNWNVTPSGTTLGDLIPWLTEIDQEEYDKISAEARNNAELFAEIARRKPSADVAYFLTTLATLLAAPEARIARSEGAATFFERMREAATARRRSTVGSEVAAGAAAGAAAPAEDAEQQLARMTGASFAGGLIHKFSTLMSATGRLIVGGRPATLQRADDLLQAERDLNAVGLLTPAELTGGRSLARVEGILDNVPFIGLQTKRGEQVEMFQNAIRTIQEAFPGTSADDALRVIRTKLEANEAEASRLFRQVADSVPDDADLVEAANYRQVAEKLYQQELAKGNRADQRTLDYLDAQRQAESISFEAARELSSDLATRTRVAGRSAQDVAATGIDEGRMKQLSLAHFKDMELWARQTGGDTFALWQSAKAYWKENVLPFTKRPLAPIFDQGYDSIQFARFLTDPTKVGKLEKLDENGALGFLIVNNAIEESTQANGVVDVRGLVTRIQRTRTRQGLERSVSDEGMSLLLGLAKLTDAAPRAFIRPGANVLATTAGTAAVVGGSLAVSDDPKVQALTGLASLATIRWLVGSRTGRAILSSAAHTQPSNRKKLAALASTARTLVQRSMLVAATEGEREAETLIPFGEQ